jgi:hypothetical protein
MTITPEDVKRFQEIWREEFVEEISDGEARYHIHRLDQLFLLFARIGKRQRRGREEPPAGGSWNGES